MREWMREARKKKGLTLKELGEALHISESYCSSIESGTRQVKLDLVLAGKLADILDMPIKEILWKEELLRKERGLIEKSEL